MNKQEFGMLAAAIKTAYEKMFPNSQAMELWFRNLQDIPYNVASAAFDKWVVTSKWAPTIADIREMSASIMSGDTALWSDGWAQVMNAIRKYGCYNLVAALATLDDITAETVNRIGYMELCRSENITADRANFRMIFDQISNRKRKIALIPAPLQQRIEQIQKGELGYECERISAPDPKD